MQVLDSSLGHNFRMNRCLIYRHTTSVAQLISLDIVYHSVNMKTALLMILMKITSINHIIYIQEQHFFKVLG